MSSGTYGERTYSDAQWVDETLRALYRRMAEVDRQGGATRPPGTTRARVDVEEMLKIKLGSDIDRFRVVLGFLLDRPDVYHEVVEVRRQDNGVTGAAWRTLVERVNEAALSFSLRVPPQPAAKEQTQTTQDARDRVSAHWDELRPSFKQPARWREDEAPPGLTEEQRKAWYESKLPDLEKRMKASPPSPLSDAAKSLMTRASLDRGGQSDAEVAR
jgi:hypothetical protein